MAWIWIRSSTVPYWTSRSSACREETKFRLQLKPPITEGAPCTERKLFASAQASEQSPATALSQLVITSICNSRDLESSIWQIIFCSFNSQFVSCGKLFPPPLFFFLVVVRDADSDENFPYYLQEFILNCVRDTNSLLFICLKIISLAKYFRKWVRILVTSESTQITQTPPIHCFTLWCKVMIPEQSGSI